MRRIVAALFLLTLTCSFALAQGQSAPTLRVVTEDPSLPSELFYGDVKVKPVRLRPGTNTPITIFDNDFFVQQQYIDFLNRFPEASGFSDWMSAMNSCSGDEACLGGVNGKRVAVSRSFFMSTEFQLKGYYNFRFYKAAFGRLPEYAEMSADMRAVTGTTPAEVFQKKAAYADGFVQRAEFNAAYGALSNDAFVNALMDRYGLQSITTIDPASPDTGGQVTFTRAQLISALTGGTLTRAKVLRAIADSTQVSQAEFNKGFVAMQYYGYLRRKPEEPGYTNWLNTINADPSNLNQMVFGFVYSAEYRNRF